MDPLDPHIPCGACGAIPIHWILARIDAVEVHGLCNGCVALLLTVRADEGTDEATIPTDC